jgi:hypothetical protein
MEQRDILRRLDEKRRGLARDGEILEKLPHLTRLRTTDGLLHLVIYSALPPDSADAAIAAEVEHHRRLGVGFEWKVYSHDRPADLRERLARQGFEVGPTEAVLVYDLGRPAEWIGDANEGVTVARVDTPELLEAFRRTAEAVFEKDYALTTGQLAAAMAAGSTQHVGYVAFVDGVPASVGRLSTHPASAFGGLYGGGTVPAHRGRGVYRAVVAARARDAIAAGARYLIVDALPTSRPILERLGFERVADTWPCEWRQDRKH